MPMSFWPATDWSRMVALMQYADNNLTSPTTNWRGIYDPETRIPDSALALSSDPQNPTAFGAWGTETVDVVETWDPDTPGLRRYEIGMALWVQRTAPGASTPGIADSLAASIWAQLQAGAAGVSLDLINQSMRYVSPPGDPTDDFHRSNLSFEVGSK